MKRLLTIATVLVVLILAGYVTVKSAEEDQKDGQTFYYYPRVNIYFDVDKERYIYADTVKGGWQKSRKLPVDEKEQLGQYVILNNPTPPVWAQNSQHRLLYGTSLYVKDDDLRRKFIEDSLRSVAPPKTKAAGGEAGKEEKPKDKRNKIERFFDRLFGKD